MKINKQVLFIVCFIFICHLIEHIDRLMNKPIIEGFNSTDTLIQIKQGSEKVRQFFINNLCPLYQLLPFDVCGRSAIWNPVTCSCDYHLCNKEEHSDVCSFSDNDDKTRPCHVVLGPEPDDDVFCSPFSIGACSGANPTSTETSILRDLLAAVIPITALNQDKSQVVATYNSDQIEEKTRNVLKSFQETFIGATTPEQLVDTKQQYVNIITELIDSDIKVDPTARCSVSDDGLSCVPKDYCVLRQPEGEAANICDDINRGTSYINSIYNIHVNSDIYNNPFDSFKDSLLSDGTDIETIVQAINQGRGTIYTNIDDYIIQGIASNNEQVSSYLDKLNVVFYDFLIDYYQLYLKTIPSSIDPSWFKEECEQYKLNGESLCLYNPSSNICSIKADKINSFNNACNNYNLNHIDCLNTDFCEYDVGCISCPAGEYVNSNTSNICTKPNEKEIIQNIFAENNPIPLDGDITPRKCYQEDITDLPCYSNDLNDPHNSSCNDHGISDISEYLNNSLNPASGSVPDPLPMESVRNRNGPNIIMNIFGTTPNSSQTDCEACNYDAHLYTSAVDLTGQQTLTISSTSVIDDSEHIETGYCGVFKKWYKKIEQMDQTLILNIIFLWKTMEIPLLTVVMN